MRHTAQKKSKAADRSTVRYYRTGNRIFTCCYESGQTGLSHLPTLFERMSLAPAKLYHLPAGQIKEDMPADLIVFDDAAEVVYEKFASKSSNSPFTGQKLYGRIEMTICEGKEIQK